MRETFKAEIINSGRITIPKTICDLYDLNDGDIIEVTFQKKTAKSQIGTLEPQEQSPLQAQLEAPVNPKEVSI